ncbi:lactate permease [Nonomuraea solani]|uniref:L-lactate permease n=1 Tax=Nonomuraea solani TaxID=1144553 RepID=A0A1H6F216_9ACTN|nr:L-lactate permease [Nonomuraea solani]SEH03239.1 lactate permease [Nonomuraea solani]
MYQQIFDPVLGRLGLSALVAAIPLVVLFVLLGVFRWKAQWAGMTALAVSIVIAFAVYGMPITQTLGAAGYGAASSFLTVIWILVNALWIFKLTESTGHFAVLRRSFAGVSDDQRIQVIIIAFAFGALLEALAGAGTPVAISAVMLIALGLPPFRAAVASLVANTAPVAFGALSVPITTLSKVTGLDFDTLGAIAGRQTSIVAVFVPLVLVFLVDGRRGVRAVWPAALVAGLAFGAGQFVFSNFISVELADIGAALSCAVFLVAFLRVWRPREPLSVSSTPVMAGGSGAGSAEEEAAMLARGERDTRRNVILAYLPYAVVIAIFVVAQFSAVKSALGSVAIEFAWPGLAITGPAGNPVATVFSFNFLPAAGTLLFVAGVITTLMLKVPPDRAASIYATTVKQLTWTIVCVLCVLALAYVMNLSGQTGSLGRGLATLGGVFAFFSPVIGWLGVAITGSDNSSNALFGAVQVAAAQQTGLSPELMAAANSSGGVVGKMISPQSLAIAAAVVGLQGREGDIFRKVIGYSLALLLVIALLVFLQSTPVLGWMLP